MLGSMQLGSIMMNYARYTEQKVSGRGQVKSFSDVSTDINMSIFSFMGRY